MEDSFNSSLASKPAAAGECCEESGWTTYFQDFSNNQVDDDDDDDDVAADISSSMVSDAASHAAWRSVSHRSHNIVAQVSSLVGSPKLPPFKLSFKTTRTKQIYAFHDDSLEDTASSPVNSPKIGDLRPYDHHMNRTKANDHHMDMSLGKGGTHERTFRSGE